MVEEKMLPQEFVSIRQIWLKRIDDCGRAIGQIANLESGSLMKDDLIAGARTVVHTVHALFYSLCDYGEALVKTDVQKYVDEVYNPKRKELWDKSKEERVDMHNRWWSHSRLAERLYEHIIEVLNKYGMLFESTPRGYSNVEIRSVE
jgi:hypothetical protein